MNRKGLLTIGMGLALFAAAATAVNVVALPFARTLYGYGAAIQWIVCALAATLFLAVGARLQGADMERLERAERVARPAFLAALLALHLLLGYLMEYTPSGDNHMLFESSRLLAAQGNFGGKDYGLYLARFSNQWGSVMLLTGYFKLLMALGVTELFYPCALLQALLYLLATNALLSIARRLRGVRGELMLLLMLALCLPVYLAASVIYTDTFSLPFMVLTLDLALRVPQQSTRRGQIICAALCGLCAFIGCQIKMTVAVVVIAAVIVWLLSMRPARAALCALLTVGILMGGTQAVHSAMLRDVLDPAVVAQQHTPAIHWVMMSIPTSDNPYGGFSGDYGITWGMMDAGASHEEVMASIYTRMKDRIYSLRYPSRLVPALLRKNAASQGDGTFGMTEMLDDKPVRENAVSSFVLEGRARYGLYMGVCSGIWSAHLLLIVLSLGLDLKERDLRAALPAIAHLGMLMFLMLWEARGRYMFCDLPVALLLSMGGAVRARELAAGWKEGRLCKALTRIAGKPFVR